MSLPLVLFQVLVIHNSKASAAQLQQLAAALTPPAGSLKEVSLGYTDWKAATGAAAAWTQLPLVQLSIYEIYDYSASGPADAEHAAELLFSPMSQLTVLTGLVCSVSTAKPSAQLLADTVSGLSRLQVGA